MAASDALTAISMSPTALGVASIVILVLALRLKKLKWRNVELSFGRDDVERPK